MDIFLLLPSTWNPWSAFNQLVNQESPQALSDLFILFIIGIAVFFIGWAVEQTIRSFYIVIKRYGLPADDKKARETIRKPTQPLFKKFNRHILEVSRHDGTDEQPRLLRTVDAAEVFRDSALAPKFTRSRLFQAMPGILTGLGVLGTFIGLQLGIGGLDLTDVKNLETSIVPLIKGCVVAFSTSVWGVFSSLLFSGVEKGLQGFAIRNIRDLQTRVDTLFPRYIPEAAMVEIAQCARNTENTLKGLAAAIGEHMQRAIGRLGAEIKDAVAQETSKGQGELAEKAAELLTNALTAELGKLKEQIGSMSREFSNQFTGVSAQLRETVESHEGTVKGLSETVENNRKTVIQMTEKLSAHDSVMQEMSTAANTIKDAADSFLRTRETMEASAESNKEAAKNSKDAADAQSSAAQANTAVAKQFETIGKGLPEIQKTLEDAARVIASISGPVSELKTYLEVLPKEQQKAEEEKAKTEEERSNRLLNMVNELAEKVGNAAEQFSKVEGLAGKLDTAANNLDGASNELAVFGNQVLDASNAQKDASDAAHKAASAGERTAEALEALPQLIRGLSEAGDSVKTGAESARDAYRELISSQEKWLKGVEIGLSAIKDRVQAIIDAYGQQIEGQTRDLMKQWTTEVADCLKTYQGQVEQLQGDLDEFQSLLDNLRKN